MKRIVTGHTPDGKSTIASESEVKPVTIAPGWELFGAWAADEVPTFPNDGSFPRFSGFGARADWSAIPTGGFTFGLFTVPPHSRERGGPGFHTTPTIDLEYVVSGELWLELDDGKEVLLRPGDTVVQNSTNHAWRNKGDEPCTVVVCMIKARPRADAEKEDML
jgi:quercetin dioxygenase-like cupin family protein